MKKILLLSVLGLAALANSSACAADRLLILAPSDLYEDWRWYATERKKNHNEVEFDVVNTAEIYKDYKYRDVRCPAEGPRTDIGVSENRYPSEAIYRWLQGYYKSHSNLKYVVLGGAWLDVTDSTVHYLQDGSEITLANAIPSLRVKPNIKDGFYNPTDLYYACLKDQNESGHHWDPNNDGIYLVGNHGDGGEEFSTRGWADVAVSRMSMKPIKMDEGVEFNDEFELVGGNRILNQHQLITNFLYKVNRAEGKGVIGRRIVDNKVVWDQAENAANKFSGDHKMAITSSYLVEPTRYLNDALVLRDENEFFDGVPNMYAPEHPAAFRDTGPHMRRHVSEVAALNRPVLDTVSFHQGEIYGKGTSAANFAQVFNTTDREIGAVNGHGWAGGTGWFSAKTFSTCSALTKINVVGISCETGYLDHYGNQNGKSVANLSLGESGMANVTKTGGFIASINNSRYGWVNWETEQLFGHHQSWRLHYWFYDGVVRGYNAGSAWLRMLHNYYNDFKYSHLPEAIPGQCYTQMMLFGDPLIAVNPEENPNAVMSIEVPASTERLEREGGLLRVMRGINVAGDKLSIGLNGGIGGVGTYETNGGENSAPNEAKNAKRPNGLKFTGEAGELTFDNTAADAYYFVNKIENAKKITFAGAGAILNTDKFDSALPNDGLVFEGKDGLVGKTAKPNVIRANLDKEKGALARFLPLKLNNTSLQFETYDAFNGYTGETFATLDNSKLTFRVSRWRGLTDRDYFETIRGNLTLNDSILAADYPASVYLDSVTIAVTGDSSIETTHGGSFKLTKRLNIVLQEGASLTIDAEFVSMNESAALNVSGLGRLVLKSIPLKGVNSLTIGSGVVIELPEGADFYQVLPSSSSLNVAAGTEVYFGNEKVNAVITKTGAIFKEGTISTWTQTDGVWEGAERYFPDVEGGDVTVRVRGAIPEAFTCFGNTKSAYTFRGEGENASITFDSLSIGGKISFLLPTVFNTWLSISAGGVLKAQSLVGKDGAPARVMVEKDGAFALYGQPIMRLELSEGAKLVATDDGRLALDERSSIIWPESGKVIVDVSEFELTSELKPIITGVKADMGFLRHLEVSDNTVSLALNGAGDVCVFKCEPGENWTREEVVEISEAEATIAITVPKRFATLTYKTTRENAVLNLVIAEGGSLLTDELRFEGFACVNLTNVKLGAGTLYAAEETHIFGDSSGRLSMTATDTVYLHDISSPWKLTESIQGIVYVDSAAVRAERKPVFVLPEGVDWPIAGLVAEPYDFEKGEVRGDFIFISAGQQVYLVPPRIIAKVDSSVNWSELKWTAHDGEEVRVSDWDNVLEVEIISENEAAEVVMNGAPKFSLVTSGDNLTLRGEGVALPSEIVFNNELTIKGAILPSLDYVKGAGKLILDTGSVTEIVIPGNLMPIEAPVEIKKGSTLRLAHEAYFQNKAANFTYISGEGTLELKNRLDNGSRFFVPAKDLMFPTTLTFKLETEIELQHIHCAEPLEVGNLSGSGSFGFGRMTPEIMLFEMGYYMNQPMGMDKWKSLNCGTRVVKSIQSDVSEWTGWMPDWYGMDGFGINFNVKLVVAGSETTPSFARRLVFSGKATDEATISCQGSKGANHALTIDPSGCFELNGYWNGNIENNGVLVLGPKRTIKKDKTSFSGTGKLAILGSMLDLTEAQHAQFATKYPLAAGSYGEIKFAAETLDTDQVVMTADTFESKQGEDLTLIAVKDGCRYLQKVSAANFVDGNLVYLAEVEAYLDVDSVKSGITISGTRTIHLVSSSGKGSVKLSSISGTAKIVIENGVELIAEMSSTNKNPFVGHEVYVSKGGRLVLLQMDNMYQSGKTLAGVDLSNLKGVGTLEFRANTSGLILKFPSSRKYTIGTIAKYYWDENLSICVNTNIYCDYSYEKAELPLVLRNLSGNGKFGLVGNPGEQRYIEIELKGGAKKSDFTGTFASGINVIYKNLRSPLPKILFR